jgi:RNA polymerase sigma-70 factor, ECF subfamily
VLHDRSRAARIAGWDAWDASAGMESLVEAASHRDPDALGEIFDRYYEPIYRYAYARLGNAADAEDAAADTFASMLRAIGRYHWRGIPFEAWLFRIASSRVIDIARRRERRRFAEDANAGPSDPPDHRADPALVLGQSEERRGLMAAIERLPRAQRDVVMLRFFLGHSIRQAAASLGRSEGAIKQLQFRAMSRLRSVLDR